MQVSRWFFCTVQDARMHVTTFIGTEFLLVRFRALAARHRKVFFCLTGPYLTGRATIGRLELPPGEGRFVDPPLREAPPRITAYTARGSSD